MSESGLDEASATVTARDSTRSAGRLGGAAKRPIEGNASRHFALLCGLSDAFHHLEELNRFVDGYAY